MSAVNYFDTRSWSQTKEKLQNDFIPTLKVLNLSTQESTNHSIYLNRCTNYSILLCIITQSIYLTQRTIYSIYLSHSVQELLHLAVHKLLNLSLCLADSFIFYIYIYNLCISISRQIISSGLQPTLSTFDSFHFPRRFFGSPRWDCFGRFTYVSCPTNQGKNQLERRNQIL